MFFHFFSYFKKWKKIKFFLVGFAIVKTLLNNIRLKLTEQHPYKNEITRNLVEVLLFEIAAVYNKENFIENTIQSILDQTFQDFEIIVVNDGSTDKTQEIVEDFIKNQAKDFIDFKAEILLKEANNDPIKKAEAIRDIVKSIGFVSNALKQEVYLKQVSTQFGLSEQSLFNELGVQKQVVQQQKPAEKRDTNVVKLEKVQEFSETINPLLVLEEKLVELMLKFGQFKLFRKTPDNENYETTVIEEIINHLWSKFF